MRITSGKARGISLLSPKGDSTRPATDAARQAIFSSIGDLIENAKVLDIFAGTGSYGLEAMSRGASSATFVEANPKAFQILKKNISTVANALGSNEKNFSARAIKTDCFKLSRLLEGEKFNFIFADPPYEMLSRAADTAKILDIFCAFLPDYIILEAPAEFELPAEYFCEKQASLFTFETIKRLGKNSRGKPSQIVFKVIRK